jgi:HNH endonuclease
MLTRARLRELLVYDQETGAWSWRVKHGVAGTVRNPGDKAGYANGDGQIRMSIDDEKYTAARLAWLYMTGEMPEEIDHRDLNKSNNAWSNLRAATRSQNAANTRKRRTNKSGFKGVSWSQSNRKFIAMITVRNKQIYLGGFDSQIEAHNAYVAAAREAFGEFARE